MEKALGYISKEFSPKYIQVPPKQSVFCYVFEAVMYLDR